MSKGSWSRKSAVNLEIRDLRYTLAFGNEQEKLQASARLIELGVIQDAPKVEQPDELSQP